MTCTYGVGAATGLFVPSLAVSAGMGHVVGRVVQGLMGGAREDHLTVSLRSYAVLGAVTSLGGATRMTLSITVLVMETTGSLQLIVPLMLVVFVSKTTSIGDKHRGHGEPGHLRHAYQDSGRPAARGTRIRPAPEDADGRI